MVTSWLANPFKNVVYLLTLLCEVTRAMLGSEVVYAVIQAEDGRDDTAAASPRSQSRSLQALFPKSTHMLTFTPIPHQTCD